jgi:hypothetical protein
VFLASGPGQAKIANWTPNEVIVDVQGARDGDLVVMNQNFDPGWRANGKATLNYNDTVAVPVSVGTPTVTFRYRSRSLPLGLGIALMTMMAIAAGFYRAFKRWDGAKPGSLPGAESWKRWRRIGLGRFGGATRSSQG